MRDSLLVLTDFTPSAVRALHYAAILAEAIGARLVLLHVRRDSLLDSELFTGQLPQRSQAAIDAALARAVRNLSVSVSTETRHGRVVPAVAEALLRHPSALVVLGRPDEEALPEELVTTTALDLLRADPQPMLVVPQQAPRAAVPRRILLAVDADPFSLREPATAMRHFFRALDANLTVLHVSPLTAEPDTAALFEAVTRMGLTATSHPPQTTTWVNPRPADGILQAAAAGHYDLIVMIARPRSFLGQLFHHSVTADILLHSPLPVLILPAR